MARIGTAVVRDTLAALACCFIGMAVGLQLALVAAPSGALAGHHSEAHHLIGRLDLAALGGMAAGAVIHHLMSRSARDAAVWPGSVAALGAMMIVHPPGMTIILAEGAPLAALRIALLMMPSAVLAHALWATVRVTLFNHSAVRDLRHQGESP